MTTRKTVPIAFIVEQLNTRLATPDSTLRLDLIEGIVTPQQVFRLGALSVVETVLHKVDAYRGFQFTDGANGSLDDTRRRYYS